MPEARSEMLPHVRKAIDSRSAVADPTDGRKVNLVTDRPQILGLGVMLGGALVAAGCAASARNDSDSSPRNRCAEEIRLILERQAQAWNDGDIDAFMVPYWHSPDLTFSSGGKVTRGWRATLDRYRQRYPNREAMGRLTFSDLEITMPSRSVALVLGRWRLDRAQPIGGNFSLVLRREAGKWIIIHDHTSTDQP